MALITCPDCGKQLSDQATACPNCGHPFRVGTPAKVEDTNAKGFLGKPGTGTHTLNVTCAVILVGIVLLVVLMVALRGCG